MPPAQEVKSLKNAAFRLGLSEATFKDNLNIEINELLREIEATRQVVDGASELGQGSSSSPGAPDNADSTRRGGEDEQMEMAEKTKEHLDLIPPLFQPLTKPKCRSKVQCHFGPGKSRGRAKLRTFSPAPRDPPPPPPLFRTRKLLESDRLVGKALIEGTCYEFSTADRIRSEGDWDWGLYEKEEDDPQVTLPDRPTFFHFSPALRSPFAHYLGSAPEAPRPFAARPAHSRLGLTEDAFGALLSAEIDEALLPLAESRRRACDFDADASSSMDSVPALTPLTEEDCLALFRSNGYLSPSSPGSMFGVF